MPVVIVGGGSALVILAFMLLIAWTQDSADRAYERHMSAKFEADREDERKYLAEKGVDPLDTLARAKALRERRERDKYIKWAMKDR